MDGIDLKLNCSDGRLKLFLGRVKQKILLKNNQQQIYDDFYSVESNSATIVIPTVCLLCWKPNESVADLSSQRFDLSLLCCVDQVVNIWWKLFFSTLCILV